MTLATPDIKLAEHAYYVAATANEKAERAKFLVETQQLKLDVRLAERREAVFEERTIIFANDVEDEEVADATERLFDFRTMSSDPVTIYLNSPGGDVFAGILLFDTLREMQLEGIHVVTKVFGYAASMASILSQAGNDRIISENSWFMVHEPATLAVGKVGDIKREAKLLEALHDQLCGILAARSTLSKAEIKRRSKDKDWWMPASEALGFGFFDEVL